MGSCLAQVILEQLIICNNIKLFELLQIIKEYWKLAEERIKYAIIIKIEVKKIYSNFELE